MTARVLIVDDDPVQRRLLDNMVRKFGHEPAIAESGDQAAALLTGGERFDCVVLDLVMPDLDGLGVLARMREAGSNVPVIVQTAHGGIDNVVSAMRAGACRFRGEAGRRRAACRCRSATRWKRARSPTSFPASSAASPAR